MIRVKFEYVVTHECALGANGIRNRLTRIGLMPRGREQVVGVADDFLFMLS